MKKKLTTFKKVGKVWGKFEKVGEKLEEKN